MPLPEGFLSELKMRNDITDVASNYVNLKRRGRNMVGLCPFHGEKTPSFNIYTENGSCYYAILSTFILLVVGLAVM